jgi:hypothetical protein
MALAGNTYRSDHPESIDLGNVAGYSPWWAVIAGSSSPLIQRGKISLKFSRRSVDTSFAGVVMKESK